MVSFYVSVKVEKIILFGLKNYLFFFLPHQKTAANNSEQKEHSGFYFEIPLRKNQGHLDGLRSL